MPKDGILKGKDEFIFIFFIKADPKGFSLLKRWASFFLSIGATSVNKLQRGAWQAMGVCGMSTLLNFFFKVFYYNAWEVTQEKHDQIFKHLRKHYY